MPPVDNAGQRDHVWRIYIKLLRHRRVALEPKPEAKMNDEIERAMDEYTASQRHRVIKMGGNAEEIAELRQQLEAERERARQAEETLGSIRAEANAAPKTLHISDHP